VDVEIGADIAAMMRRAGDKLQHVHVADSFNHKGSSATRYILNPPGTPARIHQHLDIGQGEVDRDAFFGTLRVLNFDGAATARSCPAMAQWCSVASSPCHPRSNSGPGGLISRKQNSDCPLPLPRRCHIRKPLRRWL
jgi:hypothetical protein